ncbi:hypothetical protein SARC_08906 [Sphaeroforma arctica JP610]|uniref:Uncharacterized protein n=1 Tax=Sphaeroforma arctica JP610 TaxID=667725 RepID=A0A0L0FPN3_9EUKA|nr:hypothetical protein SARC_08906 [Sphaeroforma arctica JP610]KNC78669.1 hypothetical protein SARC_08906 [Sphaeroforma arctica JP610]|eukprot:XP_014152571.1 hypothetical protein SARC_08906 [Sphaeroforma arctica JP610]
MLSTILGLWGVCPGPWGQPGLARLPLGSFRNLARALSTRALTPHPLCGEWRLESGDWRAETGEWRLESGDWRVETGEWRLESEDWSRLTSHGLTGVTATGDSWTGFSGV